jgi:hypothetical protein
VEQIVRIGLVLGAGGLTGTAFHAGVLTALAEDAGWDALRVPARARQEREAAQVRRSGTKVLVFQPDARLRQVMGTGSMDVRKRSPVAVAAQPVSLKITRRQGPS